MECMYLYGAILVEKIQKINLPPEVFLAASYLSAPPAVNLLVFPLAFFLHPILGSATLLSINFSEWLNCALKWVICGERPFWWVKTHESANLILKQFNITCETGPGSPSGHCMVFVAGWLPLILYIKHRRKMLGAVLYSLLIICTIIVGLSRLYIATHFPHQVIEGSVAGGLIGQAFYQWVMRYTLECASTSAASIDLRPSALTSPQRLTIIGTLSFVLGEAIGATLNFLGVDVDRSFRMARTYCDRREWVHPSTSVEASYARITGALLGLAGALIFRPLTVRNLKPPPVTVRHVIFPCIMCVIACYYCQRCISFIAPFFKCILGYIPLGSEASFLFYMGILGASCPLVVALAFSSLLDKLAYCKACQCTTSKHNTTPASHGHDSEASARSGRPRSRSRR